MKHFSCQASAWARGDEWAKDPFRLLNLGSNGDLGLCHPGLSRTRQTGMALAGQQIEVGLRKYDELGPGLSLAPGAALMLGELLPGAERDAWPSTLRDPVSGGARLHRGSRIPPASVGKCHVPRCRSSIRATGPDREGWLWARDVSGSTGGCCHSVGVAAHQGVALR